MAQKSGSPMSSIDHNCNHFYEQFHISILQYIHSQHDPLLAFKLVIHRLVNSPEIIDGFRSSSFPYNLRFFEPLSRHNISSNLYIFHSDSHRTWNESRTTRSSESPRTFLRRLCLSLDTVGILSIMCKYFINAFNFI